MGSKQTRVSLGILIPIFRIEIPISDFKLYSLQISFLKVEFFYLKVDFVDCSNSESCDEDWRRIDEDPGIGHLIF